MPFSFLDSIDRPFPGLVTAGFCNLCIACSLAEFLSAYPTYVSHRPWLYRAQINVTVELEDNIIGLQVSCTCKFISTNANPNSSEYVTKSVVEDCIWALIL
jgi:hypothetical protein